LGPITFLIMKLPALLLSLPILASLDAAEPIQIDVSKTSDAVILNWRGGSGIYQLEYRSDAGGGAWVPLGLATLRTSASISLSAIQNAIVTSVNGPIRPGDRATPTLLTEVFRIESRAPADLTVADNAQNLIHEGRQTFRFDTFGDEDFWGNTLQLHQAVAGAAHGGVG